MKPSERIEAFFIVGLAILLASCAFLPPSWLPKWIGDTGGLRFFGWVMLAGLCLAAIGVIREWADRRRNKWLLAFGIAPMAVLIYEAASITKALAVGVIREWRGFFGFSWLALTIYLWYRGNDYKEQLKWTNTELHRKSSRCPHCGEHL
jgi:hypothetical protein